MEPATRPTPGQAYLAASGLVKRYGAFAALSGVRFTAGRGAFVSILGPSGCGKTTVLRLLAGLEAPDAGRVAIGGRDVTQLPVSRRNVGIVFQSYALFPNLTAAENVAYGLRGQKLGGPKLARRVNELLDLVGLTAMQGKYPAALSGGQQQRVALARAMALSPDILLLDEPLSALDAKVRVHLRAEIKALQQRLGVTTVMVTHDQEEALTMADRILVMDQGRIAQEGAPREIYDRPATPFVAAFVGSMNFLAGAKKRGDGGYDLSGRVLPPAREPRPLSPGQAASLGIRPEDVALAPAAPGHDAMAAVVRQVEFRGPSTRVSLVLEGPAPEHAPIEADIPAARARELALGAGQVLHLVLPPDRVSAYAAP
ncbi:MAG: ABC transporter ATP-binding protein [Solidesulfovibrio sp. DCME]|uniref:ABC transporter ATP-binding protein n=1 Tax=Solidesulfovibrio sp. DCME TaxID=3447380 RepID=UPI003D0E7ED7